MHSSASSSGPSRPARLGLTLAAALPFLLSLGFHAVPRQPQSAAEGTPKPALAFEYYLIDRGLLPPGPFAAARFHFTNTGTQPVTITRLEPSCGCLQPRLADGKTTYQPGESGRFDIRVRTANQAPGPHEYTVRVHYADPEPASAEVAYKAVFQHQVRVVPPALTVYRSGDAPHTQDVTIIDYRGQPLRVTEVLSSSKHVSATVGAVDDRTPDERRIPITITVHGELPAARHEAVVVVRTDDPTYRQVTIPVFAQRFEPSPSALRIPRTAER